MNYPTAPKKVNFVSQEKIVERNKQRRSYMVRVLGDGWPKNIIKTVLDYLFTKNKVEQSNQQVSEVSKHNEYKVHNKAVNKYLRLCPISSKKSNYDVDDIKYKIIRAANLGQLQKLKGNETRIVGYHNLNIIIHNNEIVDIERKKRDGAKITDKTVWVSENVKNKYDRMNRKK